MDSLITVVYLVTWAGCSQSVCLFVFLFGGWGVKEAGKHEVLKFIT